MKHSRSGTVSPVKNRPRFIAFEGIDGSGKSTQARLLAHRFRETGIPVVLTSEPSDGVVGSKIKALTVRLPPEEEAHLFTEDRKDHLNRVIIPSLNRGEIVICDRYVYSSVAYQGARGLDPDEIIEINRSFALWPDVNFLLEVSVEIALTRIRSSRPDGFTPFETAADLAKVAKIYAELSDPSIVRIPGNAAPEEIHARIVSELDLR